MPREGVDLDRAIGHQLLPDLILPEQLGRDHVLRLERCAHCIHRGSGGETRTRTVPDLHEQIPLLPATARHRGEERAETVEGKIIRHAIGLLTVEDDGVEGIDVHAESRLALLQEFSLPAGRAGQGRRVDARGLGLAGLVLAVVVVVIAVELVVVVAVISRVPAGGSVRRLGEREDEVVADQVGRLVQGDEESRVAIAAALVGAVVVVRPIAPTPLVSSWSACSHAREIALVVVRRDPIMMSGSCFTSLESNDLDGLDHAVIEGKDAEEVEDPLLQVSGQLVACGNLVDISRERCFRCWE